MAGRWQSGLVGSARAEWVFLPFEMSLNTVPPSQISPLASCFSTWAPTLSTPLHLLRIQGWLYNVWGPAGRGEVHFPFLWVSHLRDCGLDAKLPWVPALRGPRSGVREPASALQPRRRHTSSHVGPHRAHAQLQSFLLQLSLGCTQARVDEQQNAAHQHAGQRAGRGGQTGLRNQNSEIRRQWEADPT